MKTKTLFTTVKTAPVASALLGMDGDIVETLLRDRAEKSRLNVACYRGLRQGANGVQWSSAVIHTAAF